MKRTLLRALALNAAAAGVLAQTPTEPKVVADAQGQAAPAAKAGAVKAEPARLVPDEVFAAELKDFYDVSFSLGEYRGRAFVLNLWASWCGPCRMELPELNKLYEEFGPRGVEFVGLTVESPGAESEKVKEFARGVGTSYRLGWADPDVAEALMTRKAVPQTLVVAADGRIVARYVGFSKNVTQQLRASIEKALEPPPEEKEEAGAAPDASAQPSPSPPAPETSRPPGS